MFEYAKGLNICNRYRMSKKNYFGEKSPCYAFGYPDHAYDQNFSARFGFKAGTTLVFGTVVAFCENCFCHNLRISKVKYTKVIKF